MTASVALLDGLVGLRAVELAGTDKADKKEGKANRDGTGADPISQCSKVFAHGRSPAVLIGRRFDRTAWQRVSVKTLIGGPTLTLASAGRFLALSPRTVAALPNKAARNGGWTCRGHADRTNPLGRGMTRCTNLWDLFNGWGRSTGAVASGL